MIAKLRYNNKAGADLQFSIATFLFIFVVVVSLLLDFWFVSAGKIAILKAVEEAELYCLVINVPKSDEEAGGQISGEFSDDISTHSYESMTKKDMTQYQVKAVACAKDRPKREVELRLSRLPYIRNLQINSIHGLTNPIGQMGITTDMKYQIKTIIKSPDQIFGFARNQGQPDLTAAKWIPLKVTSKIVPVLTDKLFPEG